MCKHQPLHLIFVSWSQKVQTPITAPCIGYLVPKCANINHCISYWVFGFKMCKHRPLPLTMVIWFKIIIISKTARPISYLVPKCAIGCSKSTIFFSILSAFFFLSRNIITSLEKNLGTFGGHLTPPRRVIFCIGNPQEMYRIFRKIRKIDIFWSF